MVAIFIKKHWFSIVLIGVLIYVLVDSQSKISKYETKITKLDTDIELLEVSAEEDLFIIDSLRGTDVIYVDRIIKIKNETDENIKFVDTMSVSDMQSFYSDRYPREN